MRISRSDHDRTSGQRSSGHPSRRHVSSDGTRAASAVTTSHRAVVLERVERVDDEGTDLVVPTRARPGA